MRDDSNRMALELSRYAAANARAEAESIAVGAALARRWRHDGRLRTDNRERIQHVLQQHEITLQGGFVIVYRD